MSPEGWIIVSSYHPRDNWEKAPGAERDFVGKDGAFLPREGTVFVVPSSIAKEKWLIFNRF